MGRSHLLVLLFHFSLLPASASLAFNDGCDSRIASHSPVPFVYERGQRKYWETLGNRFPQSLIALPENAVWLDPGAGAGNATAQAHERASIPFPGIGEFVPRSLVTIAISLDRLSNPQSFSPQVREAIRMGRHKIIEGRPIESFTTEELGPVDLITDVFGPASLTRDLSGLMNLYLSLLKPGGTALVRIAQGNQIKTAFGIFGLLWWIERQWKLPFIDAEDQRLIVLRRPRSGPPPRFPALETLRLQENAYPPDRLVQIAR